MSTDYFFFFAAAFLVAAFLATFFTAAFFEAVFLATAFFVADLVLASTVVVVLAAAFPNLPNLPFFSGAFSARVTHSSRVKDFGSLSSEFSHFSYQQQYKVPIFHSIPSHPDSQPI